MMEDKEKPQEEKEDSKPYTGIKSPPPLPPPNDGGDKPPHP